MNTFDVVVVGGGPTGEVAAGRLAEAGLSVALAESRLIGGECSYYACMPSKALLVPAQVLATAARTPGAAERLSGRSPDPAAVLARRDEIIHSLDDSGQEQWLAERGVTVFRDRAVFTGERQLQLGDGTRLAARDAVVVATGSVPVHPPVDGIDTVGAWSNVEATTASEVPGSLLVLGGGVVGVELAQAWAALGSRVALIEPGPRVLAHEEEFASLAVEDGLEAAGVTLHTGVKAASVERDGDGRVALHVTDGKVITADELLVATGRRPNVAGLGLETLGLGSEELPTDRHMRVPGHDWLYAIGDVNGRAPLTHSGKYQAAIAVDNILASRTAGPLREAATIADLPRAPRVVFTDPQVAAVGLTVDAARSEGLDVVHVDHPADGVAGASFAAADTGGMCRLVFERGTDRLVGATFVGPEMAELLQAATIAVSAGLTARQLHDAPPAFPTRSEVWLRLVDHHLYDRDGGS